MAVETVTAPNIAITISDWLMIGAVILAPLIAVRIEKLLERSRNKQDRKLMLFQTLWATRARIIDYRHVEALNMIDIEFVGKKYKGVRTAWKALLDHFLSIPQLPQVGVDGYDQLKIQYDQNYSVWANKTPDLQA